MKITSRNTRGFPLVSTAISESRLPTVLGVRSVTTIFPFSGYSPPTTATPSLTSRLAPMGILLPLPVTIPTSRPLAIASYKVCRTNSSSHSGPKSSMALQTGRKADSLSSNMFTLVKPARISFTTLSHSLPQTAICSPFVFIKTSIMPEALMNWMWLNSGWLVCRSSNTAVKTVLGRLRLALARACLGSSAFMQSPNFW